MIGSRDCVVCDMLDWRTLAHPLGAPLPPTGSPLTKESSGDWDLADPDVVLQS